MIELSICLGSSCHLKGSYEVLNTLQKIIEERSLQGRIEMSGKFCMKKCQEGVSVSIDDEYYSVSPETVRDFFNETIERRLSEK